MKTTTSDQYVADICRILAADICRILVAEGIPEARTREAFDWIMARPHPKNAGIAAAHEFLHRSIDEWKAAHLDGSEEE
jgi:hypothetical protein